MKNILTNYPIPGEIAAEIRRDFELVSPTGDRQFTDDEMTSLIVGADALLLIKMRKVLPQWLTCAKKLKVIGNLAVGYDNIDMPLVRSHGILVVNTPETVREATAEHAVALMLCAARGLVRYHNILTKSLDCSGHDCFLDRDITLYGKTLSVLGCGRVGRAVAIKAQGLGMRCCYYDPFRLKEEDEKNLALMYLPFHDALAAGDVVSLHMPYTVETHHLINDSAFAVMRRTAYFINTARGAVVDESALIRALRAGTIRGAALDVFEHEPMVSPELAELDNVVIVPHVGTMIYEVRREMLREVIAGIRAVLTGETPPNLVR